MVREHVAIQAQVMSSAELSLRARVRGLRRDDVREALWQERSLVKTWAMRGTLHLVAAGEVPELAGGSAARLGWQSAVWLRYFKVTKDEMVALQDAIGELLSDAPMTRQELADALAAKLGDPAFAERVTSSWGTFLKPAAGRGYLAFGPDRGRNVHRSSTRGRGSASTSRRPPTTGSTRCSCATSRRSPAHRRESSPGGGVRQRAG